MEEFRPASMDDLIIAVMGPTGAGKKEFIDIATRNAERLSSSTSAIQAVRIHHPDYPQPIVLIDTPGFDDTYVSDTEILERVAVWLKATYDHQTLLSGVMNFHSILESRMASTPMKNLARLRELCGDNPLSKTSLATTGWNRMPPRLDEMREKALVRDYWKEMMDQGAKMGRFDGTYESAWALLDPLIRQAVKEEKMSQDLQSRSDTDSTSSLESDGVLGEGPVYPKNCQCSTWGTRPISVF